MGSLGNLSQRTDHTVSLVIFLFNTFVLDFVKLKIDPRLMIAQILQAGNETMYGARRNLLQNHCISKLSCN